MPKIAGVPPNLIRLMGRWSSDVYQIYCKMSLEAALHVSVQIAAATVTDVNKGFKFEELELLPNENDKGEQNSDNRELEEENNVLQRDD